MKLTSPACERNRDPILDVLRRVFPETGRVLEVSAGTGMHSVWMARHLPGLDWLPTDLDAESLASIAAWRAEADLPNLRAPVALDTREHPWPQGPFEAALCCNMIHISPWASAIGLFQGLGRALVPGGVLALYGPFRFSGEIVPSNLAFEGWLKSKDQRWGVRDLDDVVALADEHGLALQETVALPANNHLQVFVRG